MKTAGIIAEYNPFHQGHHYHIEKTRRLTNADYIVVVMSGNFTQRGQAAIMDKYRRARQALENGADLVLELPVCFATASAKIFAFGGVSLLDRLGIIDILSFGSEGGALEEIQQLAAFLLKEPDDFKTALQKALKQGFSYPKARFLALEKYFPERNTDALCLPNNILALEYCMALLSLNSSMKAVPVKRLHSGYHDKELSPDGCSSATAVRRALNQGFLSHLQEQLPSTVYRELKEEYGRTLPLDINDFSSLLHYRLFLNEQEDFTVYFDVHKELSDRIRNHRYSFSNYENFCDLLKTKELTHSRISRSLLHILLNIKESDMTRYKEEGYSRYGRILGLRKSASPLLHAIKQNASVPLISKLADLAGKLDPASNSMLETDIRAAHIYESILSAKFNSPFRDEFRRRLPVI